MKQYTYHHEIRTMIGHFVSAFNDIVIKRFDADDVPQDSLQVAYSYGPKQRVFYDLAQKKTNIRLPLVNVFLSNLARSPERVSNKIASLAFNSNHQSSHFVNVAAPVPVTLSIAMTIVTKYQRDMEQILTNFIPYTDPYIAISWNHPITNQELQSKITWSGDAPIKSPDQMDGTTPYQWTCDTSFTMDGWLFKSDQQPIGKIFYINSTYTPVPEIFCHIEDNEAYVSAANTDYFTISANPLPMISNKACVEENVATTLTIYGKMFNHITGVYLSGGSGVSIPSTSAWNLLNAASSLSATTALCSSITAYAVPDFIVGSVTDISHTSLAKQMQYFEQQTTLYTGSRQTNNANTPWNMITLFVPQMTGSGYFDVIVVNGAGCGSIKTSSFLDLVNPYQPGDPNYNNWVLGDQQYPWYGHGIGVSTSISSAAISSTPLQHETTQIQTIADVAGSLHNTYFILEDVNGPKSFTWDGGAVNQITQLDCIGIDGTSLFTGSDGRYLLINSLDGRGCYWFNTGFENGPGVACDFYQQVDVGLSDSSSVIANTLLAALQTHGFADVGTLDTTVIVQTNIEGPQLAADNGTPGITCSESTIGRVSAVNPLAAPTNVFINGSDNSSAAVVATLVGQAIADNTAISTVVVGDTVTATDNRYGDRNDAWDAGLTGFTISVTNQGS